MRDDADDNNLQLIFFLYFGSHTNKKESEYQLYPVKGD